MGKIKKITIKLVKDPENEIQNVVAKEKDEIKSLDNSKLLCVKNIRKNKTPKQSSKIKESKSSKTLKPRKSSIEKKQKNSEIHVLKDILDKFRNAFYQTENQLNQQNKIKIQYDNKENMKSKETSIEYITIEEEIPQEEPSFMSCPVCETFQTITKEQMLNHIRSTHKINGSWLNNMIL